MSLFEQRPVLPGQLTVGQQLSQARAQSGRSLTQAARYLKINQRYLAALEAGEYNRLPKGVYAWNYLKTYSAFLSLDYRQLQKSFERERTARQTASGVFERQVVRGRYFVIVPSLVKNIIFILLALLCLGYLTWLIINIYRPPRLTVINPATDSQTSQERLVVRGQTEKETEVFVNQVPVVVDAAGNFSQTIDLKQGINTVNVVARKKNQRQSVVNRQVLHTKP